MTGILKRLLRDQRGGVGALSVMISVLVITATAATVDAASVEFRARALQGLADTAAVSAAGDLTTAERTVRRVLTLKSSAAQIRQVALGEYQAKANVAVANRFNPLGQTPDAVRVVLREDVPLFFGSVLGIRSVRLEKSAVAVRPARDAAAFSIGSRLLTLDPPIANAILSQLIGREIKLTALSYDNMLASSLDVDDLLDELGRNLSAEDRTDLLKRSISTRKLVDAMAKGTTGPTNLALKNISATLATGADRNLRLGSLINVAPAVKGDIKAKVPVWDLLNAALGEAAGPQTITLDADVDGPVTAKVRLAVGEREQKSPWLTVTRDGTTVVRTAQVRLHVDVTTANLAGLGRVHLPVYAEVASGKAALTSINCREDSFDVTARSGIASVALGEIESSKLSDFSRDASLAPAAVLDTALLKVRAAARINVGDSGDTRLRFRRSDINSLKAQTIGSKGILGSTLTSLVANAHLDIQVLGLGIALPGLPATLRDVLAGIAAPLDAVLEEILKLVGAGIGEADVRAAGLECGHKGSPPSLAA
jgi:uncharacterized membrane protein